MNELIDIETGLERMQTGLREALSTGSDSEPLMIGIHSGGHWLARRLHSSLGLSSPLGALDISFYRDDFSRTGLHPQVQASHLPQSPDGRTVILVDDVLYTGRTVRAALNELFDYGRPERVILAVLIDRGGRELPIAADVCAQQLDLATDAHVRLTGPDPLGLRIAEAKP